MRMESFMSNAVRFAAMVLVECGDIAMASLAKAVMGSGISKLVYIVYSTSPLPWQQLSSPSLAAAIGNLVSIFTLLLAIILSVGFYNVMWGLAKEKENVSDFFRSSDPFSWEKREAMKEV